jgi:hypothetical protein
MPGSSQPPAAVLALPLLDFATAATMKRIWRQRHTGPYNLETFVERERYCSQQLLTANGGLFTACLFGDSGLISEQVQQQQDSVDILASVDVVKRHGLLAERDHNGSVVVRQILGYSLHRLYCPPQHRGHGYASTLFRSLQGLLWRPRPATDGETSFLAFTTDIGQVCDRKASDRV